jgi:formate dehydrogenase iron-sulfur subunit
VRSDLVKPPEEEAPGAGGIEAVTGLLGELLREQHTLTAVERFSSRHDEGELSTAARSYRDLVPLSAPAPGQQYAFEVDLDACTGCKACVAACHSLNGLDEQEVWRTVGLLHGGTAQAPALQTVTTACHHCVDPACMTGCPVGAYEKDPVTGIVRHLDDQCIGCQYCTLMCPYDAPKYSPSRGIVRKCDMCGDRLAAAEAPACVQGCPNQAIRISVVDKIQSVHAAAAAAFLPGAPAPHHTLPSTIYRHTRPLPANLEPADLYAVSAEHGHPPLVVMLVLTQLAVGALALASAARWWFGLPVGGAWGVGQAVLALVLASAALGASLFHLGRPLHAWRAFLGVRTSWLSREILTFGAFAGAAVLHAGALALGSDAGLLPVLPGRALLVQARPLWEAAAVMAGVAGVGCSVMVYVATGRAHWRAAVTGPRFAATAVLLGAAAVHAVSALAAARVAAATSDGGVGLARGLLWLVVGTALAKLCAEARVLRHLRAREHTVGKRVATLMVGDLRLATLGRFIFGAAGGVLVPALTLTALPSPAQAAAAAGLGAGFAAAAVASLVLLVAGELLERSLFFTTAPPSRMPGGLP